MESSDECHNEEFGESQVKYDWMNPLLTDHY